MFRWLNESLKKNTCGWSFELGLEENFVLWTWSVVHSTGDAQLHFPFKIINFGLNIIYYIQVVIFLLFFSMLNYLCIFPFFHKIFSVLTIVFCIIFNQEWLSHCPHLYWNVTIDLCWIFGIVCDRLISCTTKKGPLGGGYTTKVILDIFFDIHSLSDCLLMEFSNGRSRSLFSCCLETMWMP